MKDVIDVVRFILGVLVTIGVAALWFIGLPLAFGYHLISPEWFYPYALFNAFGFICPEAAYEILAVPGDVIAGE